MVLECIIIILEEKAMQRLLNLSDAFSLGLHASCYLADREGELVSVREMASTLGVSQAHLAKVMLRLAREGILDSQRGPGGGFVLNRQPGEVTLMEIYESLEGPFRPRKCLLAESVCGGKNCIFHGLLDKVERDLREYLEGTSLRDVQGIFAGQGGVRRGRKGRSNGGGEEHGHREEKDRPHR